MPASTIAQILLRIFAINWVLQGLIQFSVVLGSRHATSNLGYDLAPALIYLGAGLIVWFSAPPVSRILAGADDREFDLSGVTTEQLFSTAFLALGVYFALDSFADMFSWGHYFAISRTAENEFHQGAQPSYYDLSEAVMTFTAAVALICTSRKWARRLCRDKVETPTLAILGEDSPQG